MDETVLFRHAESGRGSQGGNSRVATEHVGDSGQPGLYRPEFEHDACGIGALAHMRGERTHQMLDDALSVLVNLEHRGGKGLEKNTGDGAGILFRVPHRFFRKEAQKEGHLLPDEGDYGVAMLFFPQDDEGVAAARRVFEEGCAAEGIPLLFWRRVPVDVHDLGETARACMPTIFQAFLGRPSCIEAGDDFERALYIARRAIEKRADEQSALNDKIFYVCSMSARTIVYKGMLVATQMRRFFTDLNDAAVATDIALVHSRYSTNTTPSWERAHPNRYIIHNGEINTLKGNVNWVHAREAGMYSPVLLDRLNDVMPIIDSEGSDSAILDNVIEFLVQNGRPMSRAVSMVLPEPWERNEALSDRRRAYDEYQAMLMEPWDGPAAIAFTDGKTVGAALDRNGLRPARYYITRDDRFILSSEAGTLAIKPGDILTTGSLGPGEMLEVDLKHGRVIGNEELRNGYASLKPFREWINDETLSLDDLPDPIEEQDEPRDAEVGLTRRMAKLGYHYDDVHEVVRTMAETGGPALASMGADIPLACLSKKPRSFFDYFNQSFAQVTNPPIDALREMLVTSTVLYMGNHGNLLEDRRATCRLLRLDNPIVTKDEFDRICAIGSERGFSTGRFAAVYRRDGGPDALEKALDALDTQVEEAVRGGVNIIVISDRAAEGEVPIPSLLAVSSVHNHLLRSGLRMHADIAVETGDAISPHDFACLVGYSASCIYPYMAHECIADLAAKGALADGIDAEKGIANYNKAVVAGVLAIMSKMGISTVQGYHSAQIFEIVGFDASVVDKRFSGTVSRVGGLTLADIEVEENERYDAAIALAKSPAPDQLASSGLTKWRPLGGEEHLIDPETIYLIQKACREGNYETFKEYSAHVHRPGRAVVLRDLMEFVPTGDRVPLDEVEPATSIVKRFNTGAMSYGSLSEEAHTCLAIAMNRLGGRSNTGEGGESPDRENTLPNGDRPASAIRQVASGRFGVTSRYLNAGIELQIKMAQGAKPGEGGHLPGAKVYPWVADVRRSTPGIGLISPPPHHDIYSIEDLAELIYDLKNANPDARVSVKLVSEAGVGTIATGVAKGGAGKILISGHNGGSGAAPRDSIYHAGLPLELGLAETQQTLMRNGLRSRVVLEADGKLLDGRDVAIAALLGAEEFGFATMPLIVMGCLMQRDCQQDTCPAGIATQNCRLRGHFSAEPEHLENFMLFVAEHLREIMAELGFRTVEEMVGRVDCLRQRDDLAPYGRKASTIDLSAILVPAKCEFGASIPGAQVPHYLPEMAFDFELDRTLDGSLLIPYTASAREHLEPIRFHADIANINRCTGTMLGSQITKAHPDGMPESSVTVDCDGSAGQSFGAFLPAGVTLNVTGEANDYFGKGLSGGTLSLRPPEEATYKFNENIIVGNVAFYGATSGRAFINGCAGQRFAVRNSGAVLVVEGVGSNGCEYMTGGVALILGDIGQNFAAGMTGGIAYVFDENKLLSRMINGELVAMEEPDESDFATIHALLEEHAERTGSPRAIWMLFTFERAKKMMVKVIPHEYKRVLDIVQLEERAGATREMAYEKAFAAVRGER